jgi:hypothetical protein
MTHSASVLLKLAVICTSIAVSSLAARSGEVWSIHTPACKQLERGRFVLTHERITCVVSGERSAIAPPVTLVQGVDYRLEVPGESGMETEISFERPGLYKIVAIALHPAQGRSSPPQAEAPVLVLPDINGTWRMLDTRRNPVSPMGGSSLLHVEVSTEGSRPFKVKYEDDSLRAAFSLPTEGRFQLPALTNSQGTLNFGRFDSVIMTLSAAGSSDSRAWTFADSQNDIQFPQIPENALLPFAEWRRQPRATQPSPR